MKTLELAIDARAVAVQAAPHGDAWDRLLLFTIFAGIAALGYAAVATPLLAPLFEIAAREDWGRLWIRPTVIWVSMGLLLMFVRTVLWVRYRPFAACPPPDVVAIPDLMVPPHEDIAGRYAAEVEWLKREYARGATLAAACTGALLLAETGVLDGQDATTHWGFCETMQARYPSVRVHSNRPLVISGEAQRLIMAGGGTSWLDLGLYLIARCAGVEAAMQAARINLIDWHAVGQQPFARLARSRQSEDAIVGRCGYMASVVKEGIVAPGMAITVRPQPASLDLLVLPPPTYAAAVTSATG